MRCEKNEKMLWPQVSARGFGVLVLTKRFLFGPQERSELSSLQGPVTKVCLQDQITQLYFLG
jgi:hypothetical protein